jgi:hypothetical protein
MILVATNHLFKGGDVTYGIRALVLSSDSILVSLPLCLKLQTLHYLYILL